MGRLTVPVAGRLQGLALAFSLPLALTLVLMGCAARGSFNASPPPQQPEAATGYTAKTGWASTRFAIATANPLASDAGYQVLKSGGSAVDAAVAAQMVLTLVEPQSSGLGGGAFLLHFNGKDVEAFDGRETAPAAATPDLFLQPDGQPMAVADAAVGGRPVGVPGTLRMLEMAHREHGKLPWARLFEPAITLAENGFYISPRLYALLAADPFLKRDPVAAAYFYKSDGAAREAGSLLKNPALANVLRQIASKGSLALHEGPVAVAIADKVRQHATNPGQLSVADLASYRPVKRRPVCHAYTARAVAYRVCGFPPPSSGGIAVGQILGLLSNTPAASLALDNGLPSPEWLHLYTEASRLAFADRSLHLGDPDFVDAPAGDWMSLLDAPYLATRAALITHGAAARSMHIAQPGRPMGAARSYAPMADQTEYGTSHLSVVDAAGNALALTTTVESAFGARQMVHGFLLNNELTDFSFAPAGTDGAPVANRVQPGKRPMSSMAPTLVFEQASGQLALSVGGAGGPFIIRQASGMVFATLNWGLNVQQAANLPMFSSLNGPTLLEKGRFPVATIGALRAMGHDVVELDLPSGIQAVQRTGTGWFSAADPRREGKAMGD